MRKTKYDSCLTLTLVILAVIVLAVTVGIWATIALVYLLNLVSR